MASTNLQVVISAKDQFTGTANRVVGSLNRMDSAAGRVGRGTGQMASGFLRAGAVAATFAVTGLGVVAKKTIDWESSLAGVNKTMDLTSDELAGLGTDIRKMATEIPLAATEIAGLVEQAGALGIKKEDVLQFAKATATIGVTTNVSAQQAASSLGVLSNLLGLQGEAFDRFGSALVDLGNKGASTEDAIIQIAQRAAGAAATIGLSAEQLLGWSSAIANIGMQPDAAGTAFQTFALEMQAMVLKGKGALEVIAKTAGVTGKEFKKAFEEDASGALRTFMVGLSKLSKGDRSKLLEELGFNEARMRRMLLGLAEAEKNTDNIADSLKISSEAWKANTAAAEEADKRYGTVASKLTLLNNQFTEAALLIGEGFLPALGRVADKLKTALGDEATRNDLKKLGQDLGAALDSVDWNQVIGAAREFASVLKTALGISKSIFDVINKLPTEVKASAAAFLVLDKASGGLIGAGAGNIIGGLGEGVARSAGSRLPGVGRLFAQPVFVTNWPVGGMGGGVMGGGKGGGALGALTTGLSLLSIVASVMAVVETQQSVSGGSSAHAQEVAATGRDMLANTSNVSALRSALDGIDQGINDITSNPLNVLVQGSALDELRTLRSEFVGKIDALTGGDAADKTTTAVESMKGALATEIALDGPKTAHLINTASKTGFSTVFDATKEAEAAVKNAGDQGSRATHQAERGISATIRANRPIITTIVNVSANSYTKSVTTQERYGKGNGSRDVDTGHASGTGPLP